MARVHIDCREFRSEINGTLALVADSDERTVGRPQYSTRSRFTSIRTAPEFRTELRKIFKQGNPRP